VPFRQSKLTHVLKDTLGGNCKTSMIANIWGEAAQLEETISVRFTCMYICMYVYMYLIFVFGKFAQLEETISGRLVHSYVCNNV
jgi:hypothetical protein